MTLAAILYLTGRDETQIAYILGLQKHYRMSDNEMIDALDIEPSEYRPERLALALAPVAS